MEGIIFLSHPEFSILRSKGRQKIGKEREEYCQNSHFAPQNLKPSICKGSVMCAPTCPSEGQLLASVQI